MTMPTITPELITSIRSGIQASTGLKRKIFADLLELAIAQQEDAELAIHAELTAQDIKSPFVTTDRRDSEQGVELSIL